MVKLQSTEDWVTSLDREFEKIYLFKGVNNMSLSSIFKINAVFAAMWGIQLVFVPNMVFAQYGWEATTPLLSIAEACGTAMGSLAIISWMTPTWTSEDGLKKAALWFSVTAVLFVIMQIHLFQGRITDYVSTAVTALFAIGFYMKSR